MADSPFSGLSFGYFHLETFETGSPERAGLDFSELAVVLSPGALPIPSIATTAPSDGSGTGGHSLYTNFGSTSLRFTFNAGALGGIPPTDAGIVWTDVGLTTSTTGLGSVSFEAFDQLGASLGVIGPFVLGDGSSHGGTAEDRFFGVTNPAGLSAIEIRMPRQPDWEVDHLRFGAQTSRAGARVSDAPAGRMRCSVGNVRATMQMTGARTRRCSGRLLHRPRRRQ